ncbi:hypothetical protein DdX_02050 [Ditylenchus destructor]|uniref:Uncharacterized protein n=1 Tax=Ditylenchus destructor TaxID=166010 RepID=A0AAD4NGW7_9BILA|nr:hypothetical protein DdX_02050 [Ditylenchus destructor]
MSQLEENLHQIGRKIDQQVLRVSQRDVQELREQYEKARKKEIEANQMLLIERSRSKTQEREIDRRRKQLEESTDLIRKLQTDLDESRRVASGVKWELRENEIRACFVFDFIYNNYYHTPVLENKDKYYK